MLSATADTNIYISAFQFGGTPARFLDLAVAGEFRLDISHAIREETLRVLSEKFQWADADLQRAELVLTGCTHVINPSEIVDIIKTDPDDNRILECAAAANSDCIVTGDKKHILPLGSFRGKPILTLADFLKRIS